LQLAPNDYVGMPGWQHEACASAYRLQYQMMTDGLSATTDANLKLVSFAVCQAEADVLILTDGDQSGLAVGWSHLYWSKASSNIGLLAHERFKLDAENTSGLSG
jgi:hypothetical protein